MEGQAAPLVGLGFRFGPTPVWAFEALARGELTADRFVVIAVLFHNAWTKLLRARKPTPTLSLGTLAAAIRYGHDLDSLSRQLRRMRADGLFDYRVAGTAKSGYRYEFLLYPDGPRPSALRPTFDAQAQSGLADPPESLSASACPTSSGHRPTSSGVATPGLETDAARPHAMVGPTSLDVRDDSKPLSKGAKEGEASSSRARAGEEQSDEDQEAEPNQLADEQLAWIGTARFGDVVSRYGGPRAVDPAEAADPESRSRRPPTGVG